MERKTVFFISICLLVASVALGAEKPKVEVSWPVARGSISREGVSKAVLPVAPTRLWKFQAEGSFLVGPIVVNSRVYAGTDEGEVFAIDLVSGKKVWAITLEQGVVTEPAYFKIGERKCITLGDDYGIVYALDAANGKEVWRYDTESELHSSPAPVGDKLLFGSYNQNLYCLDAATGKVVWKYETAGPLHCGPAIADGLAFVSGCDQQMRAIDIATGKEKWAMDMDGYASATPVSVGGNIYVGHYAGAVISVDAKKGELLWSYPKGGENDYPFHASCAVDAKRVIAAGHDKKVHSIDRATGKSLWTFKAKAQFDSSPVIVGDRVLAASHDGRIYLLNIATGKKVWEYVSGAPFEASPAVAQDRFVIGDLKGMLLCFGKKEQTSK